MFIRNALIAAISTASLGLTGCLDSGGQTNKNANPVYKINGGPSVERGTHPLFSPLDTEFVIPSDALFYLSDVDDGTMLNGTDPANPVTQGIGYLDGASVLAPIDIKISASLDAGQTLDANEFILSEDGKTIPNPNQNVFLIPVDYAGGDPLEKLDGEAPGLTTAARYRQALRLQEAGDTAGAEAIFAELRAEKLRVELLDIDGGTDNLIRVLPLTPLSEKTQYVLALSDSIVDAEGKPLVGSVTYQSVANPDRVLSNPLYQPFRDAMLPARKLAADYFDFKREHEASAGFKATFADIPYATMITTTAVDDVLLANAAPVTYFKEMLTIEQRKSDLQKLFDGFYNLSGQTLAEGSAAEQNLNAQLYADLTDSSFEYYDAELAAILEAANANGVAVAYGDVIVNAERDRRLAHAIQAAAAQASDENMDVSADAQSMADAADVMLDTPKPRTVKVFSQRPGGDVNPALEQDPTGVTPINIRVYEGEITLPYFQALPEDGDGSVLKTSNWLPADFSADNSLDQAPSDRISYRFPFAAKTADTIVPIVVAAPSTTSPTPTNGFPVIIYQHAATQDRSAILPMATAAGLTCISNTADDCFVTIGIDQPLHGIFEEDGGAVGLSPISTQAGASAEATERHFGFAADAELNAVPAASLEEPGSGDLFLNFANYANTRDNMRQSAIDLLNVNASLQNLEDAINACSTCDNTLNIDPTRVYFMTHSLSGMGGAAVPHLTNVAIDEGNNTDLNRIQASVFFNTGGNFTRLIENSQSVAPRVLPGLDDASDGLLAQGRTELNIYFNVFQAQLDSVDPTAFAPFYKEQPVLLTEIAGDPEDPEKPTDNTVPNAADEEAALPPLETTIAETGFVIKGENMPLAGTDPLAAAMGASAIKASSNTLPVITRYTEGAHGNPISAGTKSAEPYSSSAVFSEMTAQMLELFTDGTVSVDNGCVVQGVAGSNCDDPENSDPGEEPGDGNGGGDGGDNGQIPIPIPGF
ncbi:hypothetical protein DOQ08_01085 [Marinobacter litoralis]|uniref:Bacterial virulence factor lipase N-terminal domain-containing protein n=1 Tax=Marinobacter litoralis TaxID=187981 RepID=A0A3M2RM73_9GAMM|nr:hypothetical protein [Marinobacter litoralis]RMJ06398.1 hypothetical protein DOQ08_01085 [Marinobacter litoralis]